MNRQSLTGEQILVYREEEKVLVGSPLVEMRVTWVMMTNGGVGQLSVLTKGIDEKVEEF